MKPRRLYRPSIVSQEVVERPANPTGEHCECCGLDGPGPCPVCVSHKCASCLDPKCRCCAAPRFVGAEDIECQHEWDDEEWYCLRCGETEPPEGAPIIKDDPGDGR